MQDHPGAPGTARQGTTRTIVSTYDGGNATQPRAPGHERPRAAPLCAAWHDRPRATLRAPGADVPPATTAGAPGQYRLSAVPAAPDHDRSRARHQRAPGHGRPLAASSGAVGHDRPRATLRAPGADVPPATAAGAPGQHRPSAAHWAPDHLRSRPAPRAPGRGRPLAASSGVAGHDRPRATPRAPGADVPPATTAGAPGQHRPSAVAIATVASPAGLRRLRQVILPRTPATPNTLTYPHSHRDTASSFPRQRKSGHVPTNAVGAQHVAPVPLHSGGTLGIDVKVSFANPVPLLRGGTIGGPVSRPTYPLFRSTTHQVHPAIQVPPRPRSCSTAATGLLRLHPSRAPPPPTPGLVIAAEAAIQPPSCPSLHPENPDADK